MTVKAGDTVLFAKGDDFENASPAMVLRSHANGEIVDLNVHTNGGLQYKTGVKRFDNEIFDRNPHLKGSEGCFKPRSGAVAAKSKRRASKDEE